MAQGRGGAGEGWRRGRVGQGKERPAKPPEDELQSVKQSEQQTDQKQLTTQPGGKRKG